MSSISSAFSPFLVALAALVFTLGSGCGRPFKVATPNRFVELADQEPLYDYRATTPDGVVVGVRAIEDSRGDIPFWTDAITLRMRTMAGYSLLDTRDVVSADGTRGKQLKFGHDEAGKPYLYMTTLFKAQGRLFLLEAGGANDAMLRYMPQIEWQVRTFRARCSFWLAPVLASRTCNRW